MPESKPLEVELYVCEECRRNGIPTVGRLPENRGGRYKGMCTGPIGHEHPKRAMQLRPFREQVVK